MNDTPLSHASTYYLLLELLEDGRAGLVAREHDILESDILEELRLRTGKTFASRADWVNYFIRTEELGSDLERANLYIFFKTQEAMMRIWKKINEG